MLEEYILLTARRSSVTCVSESHSKLHEVFLLFFHPNVPLNCIALSVTFMPQALPFFGCFLRFCVLWYDFHIINCDAAYAHY